MNYALIIGGVLSLFASLMHIAVIYVGADWYRLFGAGEDLAVMAEQGSWFPPILTAMIAGVLFVWALFAFSGAGLMRRLPMLRQGLVAISGIYLARGIGPFVAMPFMPDFASTFWVLSSSVCTLYGLAYAIGTYTAWNTALARP